MHPVIAASKVGLLLSATLLARRVFPSPTPTVKRHADFKSNGPDEMDGLVRWTPVLGKIFVWTFTVCEVLVIAAANWPSLPGATFVVSLLTHPADDTARELHMSTQFLVGWALVIVGGSYRLLCYRILGRRFTYRLTIVDGHELVTTGPYALVRHPGYTAWIVFSLGLILMHLSPGSWIIECGSLQSGVGRAAVSVWVIYSAFTISAIPGRIRREDALLREHFGDRWVQWSKSVRYRLIPGLY
ncbi:hypothetical protein C8Q77DRAFT_910402 [Trametes polyzona]|nr:hypothetical protein C8Q77DRAFT_910402 [Trametes polyzona]